MIEKQPLYINIKNHLFEDNQILDIPTLDWLKDNQKFECVNIGDICKSFRPLEKKDFVKFSPMPEWFNNHHRILCIHGKSHALRVIMFAYILCNLNNIEEYQKYLIVAAIHDIARISDKNDPKHGEMASEWFLKNKSLFSNLEDKEVEEIAICTKYHDVDYTDIPKEVLSKFGKMIDVIKCADALDRFRLPKEDWWTKKEFIKLKIPDRLLDFSNRFIHETESLIVRESLDALDAILLVGCKLGLIA